MVAWAAIAGTGLQFASSLFGSSAANAVAKAQNELAKAQAEASNKARQANNQLAAASGDLTRWQTSIQNQDIQKSAGDMLNVAALNILRNQDVLTASIFESGIQTAEQVGALIADSAFRGVGGTTNDLINMAVEGKQARATENAIRTVNQGVFDTKEQAQAAFNATLNQQNLGIIFDSFDYGFDVYYPQATQSTGQQILSAAASATSTFASLSNAFAKVPDTGSIGKKAGFSFSNNQFL